MFDVLMIFSAVFYYNISSSMISMYNCEYFEMELHQKSNQIKCIDTTGEIYELTNLLFIDGRIASKKIRF